METDFCQGCVFVTLLFGIFFAAVLHLALARFEVKKRIMDAPVSFRKNRGDGASINHIQTMIVVIVTLCASYVVNVSESKTELFLCDRGVCRIPQPHSASRDPTRYSNKQQAHRFVYIEGNVKHNTDQSIEVNARTRITWCSFRKNTFEL